MLYCGHYVCLCPVHISLFIVYRISGKHVCSVYRKSLMHCRVYCSIFRFHLSQPQICVFIGGWAHFSNQITCDVRRLKNIICIQKYIERIWANGICVKFDKIHHKCKLSSPHTIEYMKKKMCSDYLFAHCHPATQTILRTQFAYRH